MNKRIVFILISICSCSFAQQNSKQQTFPLPLKSNQEICWLAGHQYGYTALVSEKTTNDDSVRKYVVVNGKWYSPSQHWIPRVSPNHKYTAYRNEKNSFSWISNITGEEKQLQIPYSIDSSMDYIGFDRWEQESLFHWRENYNKAMKETRATLFKNAVPLFSLDSWRLYSSGLNGIKWGDDSENPTATGSIDGFDYVWAKNKLYGPYDHVFYPIRWPGLYYSNYIVDTMLLFDFVKDGKRFFQLDNQIIPENGNNSVAYALSGDRKTIAYSFTNDYVYEGEGVLETRANFKVQHGNKTYGPIYGAIKHFKLSNDGSVLAFAIDTTHLDIDYPDTTPRRMNVIINGKNDKNSYQDVSDIVISPSDNTVAYSVKKNDKWYLKTSNGRLSYGPYKEIKYTAFTDDGKSLVMLYDSAGDRRVQLQIGAKRFGPYRSVEYPMHGVMYDDDSIRALSDSDFLFIAEDIQGHIRVVSNYEDVAISFNPDFGLKYIKTRDQGKEIYFLKNDSILMFNGKKKVVRHYIDNDYIVVYPNMKEVIYVSREGGIPCYNSSWNEWYLYVGNNKYGPYTHALSSISVFNNCISFIEEVGSRCGEAMNGSITIYPEERKSWLVVDNKVYKGTIMKQGEKITGYIYYENGKVEWRLF